MVNWCIGKQPVSHVEWPVDWSLDARQMNFSLVLVCVCVDDVVNLGVEPLRGCLATGLKIGFLGIIRQ